MATAVLANPEYDVLNVVALKKMSTTQALAEATPNGEHGGETLRTSERNPGGRRSDIPLLAIGEEFGQRARFTLLLRRRWRDIEQTERFRQPAGAVEKAFSFLGHIGLLQMVDQLRGRLAFCFPNRFEDSGFCDAAEIVVDRWSPSHFSHVESDGPRKDIRVVKPGANAVGRDTALIIAVGGLVERVHRK